MLLAEVAEARPLRAVLAAGIAAVHVQLAPLERAATAARSRSVPHPALDPLVDFLQCPLGYRVRNLIDHPIKVEWHPCPPEKRRAIAPSCPYAKTATPFDTRRVAAHNDDSRSGVRERPAFGPGGHSRCSPRNRGGRCRRSRDTRSSLARLPGEPDGNGASRAGG